MDDRFDKENIEAETRYPRREAVDGHTRYPVREERRPLRFFLRSIIQSCPDGR